MATTPLQHLRLRLRLRHQTHLHPSPSLSSPPSLSSFPKRHPSLSSPSFSLPPKRHLSLSATSTPTSSLSSPPSLSLLAAHLSANDFLAADDVTRRLLILLAGDAAQKRGYVFFSEVQFIPAESLLAIDKLWLEHSNGKYGYSVQRKLWEKVQRDFTRFFVKVGWMKKLDTEVEQYNYRGFPEDFMWGKVEEAPEGHLPLTNALRGTQLLYNILTHPAFDGVVEDSDGEVAPPQSVVEGSKAAGVRRLFRTDYSF